MVISPQECVGVRVAKIFDGEVYFGTVQRYDNANNYWCVVYDDGDKEDYEKEDLLGALVLYQKRAGDDPKKLNKKTEPVNKQQTSGKSRRV